MSRNNICTWTVLLLLIAVTDREAYGQVRTKDTLTKYLRELSYKHNIKISFSPSITDKIYPKKKTIQPDAIQSLSELLKESGMTFRRIGDNYVVIRNPHFKAKDSKVKKDIPQSIDTPKDSIEMKNKVANYVVPDLSRPPMITIAPTPLDTMTLPRNRPILEPKEKRVWAIKTNLLYGISSLTPNLAVETSIGMHNTLELSASYNWINHSGERKNNKKMVHWLMQSEYRHFLREKFNGHFLGAHILISQYNIGGYELPMLLGKGSKNYRHEGWAIGTGMTYGYLLDFNRNWGLEFNVGVGYMNLRYDKFKCPRCGVKIASGTKNYFGPTKAAISLVYRIK